MPFYVPRSIDIAGRKLMMALTFAPAKGKARKIIDDKRPRLQSALTTAKRWRATPPSYVSEHMRMKPVMDQVRKSQDCKPISAGFEIQGEVQARVTWAWHDQKEQIIGVNVKVEESQFELVEQKVKVLFTQAGLPEPACIRA